MQVVVQEDIQPELLLVQQEEQTQERVEEDQVTYLLPPMEVMVVLAWLFSGINTNEVNEIWLILHKSWTGLLREF